MLLSDLGRFPLERSRTLELLEQLRAGTLPTIEGNFLCFFYLLMEERIGDWRYAGHASTLGEALARIDAFQREMHALAWAGEPEETYEPLEMLTELLTADVLEMPDEPSSGYAYAHLSRYEIGPHRVILFGEGGAPHDDMGLCIVEVPTSTHALLQRAPENERPETWPAPGEEW